MSRLDWKLVLFPLLGWPTRRDCETVCGYNPELLARMSAAAWRLFRATAVGCGVAWLAFVGLLGGSAMATGEPFEWQLARLATVLLGTLVLLNYPWAFRDQGSRWVRWLVLAVGLPSVALAGLTAVGS